MKEIKFQDWRLTVFWIGVAAGAAIVGFVFGWLWRDRPGALANVSLLNAMTAIGTVGSVGAACYFSAASLLRSTRDAKTAACLAFKLCKPEFDLALGALHSAVWDVRRLALTGEGKQRGASNLYSVSRLIPSLALPSCREKCTEVARGSIKDAEYIADVILLADRVTVYAKQVESFGETQPNGGGIVSFLLLQEICGLGRQLDAYYGHGESAAFDLERQRDVARRLGIEETIFSDKVRSSKE
ncbi:hypothetical protein [Bordetella trematum]|uniref:hypothetical protein n=1 Tax=Bordetella trematum TaxID=123899 RepID=UPI0015C55B38|nr:hypothetical protein [Bordetella trematum]